MRREHDRRHRVLGSTYDGSYEPIEKICRALDDLQKETGLDIPVHVDAASGGFVAPFLDPDLEWDFRLERVVSINASGHKYGLVAPGVGWIIWRDEESLPEDLIFKVNYLGDIMPTFALNFSRPGAQVVAQYYNFLRLGFEGYRRVQAVRARRRAGPRARDREARPVRAASPAATSCRSSPSSCATTSRNFTSSTSRTPCASAAGRCPAYTFPANREDLAVLRIVVKRGFTHDVAGLFVGDLQAPAAAARAPAGAGGGRRNRIGLPALEPCRRPGLRPSPARSSSACSSARPIARTSCARGPGWSASWRPCRSGRR